GADGPRPARLHAAGSRLPGVPAGEAVPRATPRRGDPLPPAPREAAEPPRLRGGGVRDPGAGGAPDALRGIAPRRAWAVPGRPGGGGAGGGGVGAGRRARAPARAAPPAAARHTIMNRRLDIRVYRARPLSNPESASRDPRPLRWFTPHRLRSAAIPTLTRRIAA